MIYNIFKNIFLGLFGVAVIAILLTIAFSFNTELKEDQFSIAYISITWSVYIVFKAFSEYHQYSKNK